MKPERRNDDCWREWALGRPLPLDGKPAPDPLTASEKWALAVEQYVGERIFQDSCRQPTESGQATLLAWLITLQTCSLAVHKSHRAEDLADALALTREYCAALELEPAESARLEAMLRALDPFDARTLGELLLSLCWSALRLELYPSARTLAEVSYDVGCDNGLHEIAEAAARAMSRVARMDECPRASRRWRLKASVHRRSCEIARQRD